MGVSPGSKCRPYLIRPAPHAWQLERQRKGPPPELKVVESGIQKETKDYEAAYMRQLKLLLEESYDTGTLSLNFKNLEVGLQRQATCTFASKICSRAFEEIFF